MSSVHTESSPLVQTLNNFLADAQRENARLRQVIQTLAEEIRRGTHDPEFKHPDEADYLTDEVKP